jgi:ubiquinone biosynthesis protein
MVLMVKALVTYEGVGHMLDPSFNVVEVSQRHISALFRQQYSPMRLLRIGLRMAPDLMEAVSKMPVLVAESLRILERRARQREDSPVSGLRATLLGGCCLISGSILAALEGPWPVWILLLVLGILIAMRRGDRR